MGGRVAHVHGVDGQRVVDTSAVDGVLYPPDPGMPGTNEVRDQVIGLIRDGGRGIFIIGGAPPAREGVEFQSFAAVVNAPRLEAVATLAASGKLRMPIEAEFPLERAREALSHVAARHTVGRVVLRLGS